MEIMRYSITKRNRTICRRILSVLVLWMMAVAMPSVAMAQAATSDDGEKTQDRRITTAREAFTYLDIPALELLKRTTRLDMLDYLDADSIYKATNAMGGLSWIEKCTPDYMKVQLTPVSTLELKLLQTKKDGVVTMAVYTVGDESQAEDSQITFTDEKLHPIDASKFFRAPKLEEFFDIPKGSQTTMKEIKEMIPFPTVAYSASPESNDLTARLTVEKFMNLDDWNIVKLFLKPSIQVRLKGLK